MDGCSRSRNLVDSDNLEEYFYFGNATDNNKEDSDVHSSDDELSADEELEEERVLADLRRVVQPQEEQAKESSEDVQEDDATAVATVDQTDDGRLPVEANFKNVVKCLCKEFCLAMFQNERLNLTL